MIPVGGFNRFAGEEGPNRDEDKVIPKERLLSSQSPGRRAFIIVAGPVFNLLVAALAFFLVFSLVGINTPTTRILEVLPGYPAEKAGIQAGDTVTSVAGIPVETWDEMVQVIQVKAGQDIGMTVKRDGEIREVQMTPIEMSGVENSVRPPMELTGSGS